MKTWRLVGSWALLNWHFSPFWGVRRFKDLVWLLVSSPDHGSMNAKSFKDYNKWIKTETCPLSDTSFMMSSVDRSFYFMFVFIVQEFALRRCFLCIFDVERGSRLLNFSVFHGRWVAWRYSMLRDREMAIRCFWEGKAVFHNFPFIGSFSLPTPTTPPPKMFHRLHRISGSPALRSEMTEWPYNWFIFHLLIYKIAPSEKLLTCT